MHQKKKYRFLRVKSRTAADGGRNKQNILRAQGVNRHMSIYHKLHSTCGLLRNTFRVILYL